MIETAGRGWVGRGERGAEEEENFNGAMNGPTGGGGEEGEGELRGGGRGAGGAGEEAGERGGCGGFALVAPGGAQSAVELSVANQGKRGAVA